MLHLYQPCRRLQTQSSNPHVDNQQKNQQLNWHSAYFSDSLTVVRSRQYVVANREITPFSTTIIITHLFKFSNPRTHKPTNLQTTSQSSPKYPTIFSPTLPFAPHHPPPLPTNKKQLSKGTPTKTHGIRLSMQKRERRKNRSCATQTNSYPHNATTERTHSYLTSSKSRYTYLQYSYQTSRSWSIKKRKRSANNTTWQFFFLFASKLSQISHHEKRSSIILHTYIHVHGCFNSRFWAFFIVSVFLFICRYQPCTILLRKMWNGHKHFYSPI